MRLHCSNSPSSIADVFVRSIKYQVSQLFSSALPTQLANISYRPYWRCYFPNTSAIIYVIDSSDHARLQTSRAELLTMLSEEELNGVPLLVFANKQDVDGAIPPETISDQLGLAGGEKGREWSVRGSCAKSGEGLDAGLDWYVALTCHFFLCYRGLTYFLGWSTPSRRLESSVKPLPCYLAFLPPLSSTCIAQLLRHL